MKYVAIWVFVFTLYVLFAGSTSLYTLVTGFIVSTVLSFFFAKYLVSDERKLKDIKRLLYLAFYFIKYVTVIEFKAHMDVAKRIITGEIKPGIVKVPIGVSSAYSRLLVACSITNTPGTVVVDEKDGFLHVNWIYVKTLDPAEAKRIISEEFERYARVIFD